MFGWVLSVMLWVFLAFAGTPLDGTWANGSGSFHFEPDGRAAITWTGQGTLHGQWQVSGDLLVIQTPQGVMQFQAGLQGDVLYLQDAQGSYSMQRVTTRAVASPQRAPSIPPSGGGGVMTDAEFATLLDTYPTMHPDQVFQAALRFSTVQHQWLQTWDALGSDIYTRMCHGSYATQVRFQHSTGLVGCPTLLQWEQMSSQYSLGGPREADTQRLAVKNMLGCSTGQFDATSCAAYRAGQATANESLDATGQAIVDIATCTHYRDETGKYLGCW